MGRRAGSLGLIFRLADAWAAKPGGMVIGSRLHARAEIPPVRYWANRFAYFWIGWAAAGYAIADSQSGFRIYPAALFAKAKVNYDEAHSFVFESEILIEAACLGVFASCVPIGVIYSSRTRPSHFRPVVDIARIVRMVAWRLLARGLYLQGLVRSLKPV